MAITFNRSAIARRPWTAVRDLPFLARWAVQRTFRRLTARWRILPDFVIIGAQRCGTTSLYNYVADHPGVVAAFMKETHFFDLHFSKGLGWYQGHFPMASAMRAGVAGSHRPLVGEATPYYLFYPHAARRLRAAMPSAKLVVLLRNPVDRAYSHYHHEVSMGVETLPFEDALAREEAILPAETARLLSDEAYRSFAHFHYSYVARGIYVDQLRPWKGSAAKSTELGSGCFLLGDDLLVIRSEDFYSDPAAVVGQVLAFLGLPTWLSGTYKKYNLARYTDMNPATRERLGAFYRPHNQRLYEALGTDLNWDG